jgi:hypothetical protein
MVGIILVFGSGKYKALIIKVQNRKLNRMPFRLFMLPLASPGSGTFRHMHPPS